VRIKAGSGSDKRFEAEFLVSDESKFFGYAFATGLFVLDGKPLPESLMGTIHLVGSPYVYRSQRSSNLSSSQIAKAARLGEQPLRKNSRVFSGLPQSRGLLGFVFPYLELDRMGLDWRQNSAWKQLKSDLESRLGSAHRRLEVAVKRELLEELSSGNSDVVVLIAHNDGKQISLSGTDGATVTFEEISTLQRQTTPNRVIVLITCSAGTVNKNTESLSELLLRKKLAKTVFASPKDVNAQDLPELLVDLLVNDTPIRTALAGKSFIQIVHKLINVLGIGS
jgi:hypothetical protein